MAYELLVSDCCEEALSKHCKKNSVLREAVDKKIRQVLENPYHFKPLGYPLQNMRRVHIGSFVLIYDVIEETKTVRLLKFSHHDEAY
jgi:mRNA-degrading endonuclease RelE of RelBE toxin-antitoxin system